MVLEKPLHGFRAVIIIFIILFFCEIVKSSVLMTDTVNALIL